MLWGKSRRGCRLGWSAIGPGRKAHWQQTSPLHLHSEVPTEYGPSMPCIHSCRLESAGRWSLVSAGPTAEERRHPEFPFLSRRERLLFSTFSTSHALPLLAPWSLYLVLSNPCRHVLAHRGPLCGYDFPQQCDSRFEGQSYLPLGLAGRSSMVRTSTQCVHGRETIHCGLRLHASESPGIFPIWRAKGRLTVSVSWEFVELPKATWHATISGERREIRKRKADSRD